MIAGASPAITATDAGYEVAYECAPPPPAPTPTPVTPTPTTPVTVTTPTGTTHQPKAGKDLKLHAEIPMTYSRHTTRIVRLRFTKAPPQDLRLTVTCERTRAHACPKLGKAKRTGTLGERMSDIIAGRSYPAGVTPVLTFEARGYHSEVFTIPMPPTRCRRPKPAGSSRSRRCRRCAGDYGRPRRVGLPGASLQRRFVHLAKPSAPVISPKVVESP